MMARNCFDHRQGFSRTLHVALFEVLSRLTHGVRDVGKAEDWRASNVRKRIQRRGFHFDCKHAFGSSRLNRFKRFAEWSIGRPAGTDNNVMAILPNGFAGHCNQVRVCFGIF